MRTCFHHCGHYAFRKLCVFIRQPPPFHSGGRTGGRWVMSIVFFTVAFSEKFTEQSLSIINTAEAGERWWCSWKDLAWASHTFHGFFLSDRLGCFVCAMVYFIFSCASMELSFVSAQGWVNIFGATCALSPRLFRLCLFRFVNYPRFNQGLWTSDFVDSPTERLIARILAHWKFTQEMRIAWVRCIQMQYNLKLK